MCSQGSKKRNKKFEENFCSFLASLFLLLIFFCISDTGVFLSVVVKKYSLCTLNTKAKACGGHSLTVVMRSLLKGGEEYSSTDDDY